MIIGRLLTVLVLIIVFAISLIVRLFNVQINHHEEYEYLANRQQTSIEYIKPDRGKIFDKNGVVLAFNENDVSFYVDLRMATSKDREMIASLFSSIIGKDKKYYNDIMNKGSYNVLLEKKVPKSIALKLKEKAINGLFFIEDPTRKYEYNNLASHVLGYLDDNYNGFDGIEKSYQKDLIGIKGEKVIIKDALGGTITVLEHTVKPAQNGADVYLTIDKEIQTALELYLKEGKDTFGANNALGIVMNPNSGEVIAMATVDDFNPNNFNAYPDAVRRNKILTDTYEPGSTFKAVSMASFLDKGICNENEKIFAENGVYKFKKVTIKDSHGEGWLTVKEVFSKSSNIGMSKLSQRIDDESFYKYLRNFGFGNFTNIDLAGETKGTLKKPTQWSDYSKSSLSFGYEVAVTPIQIITACSAIINGGFLYQPQVVSAIKYDDNTYKKVFEPKFIRKVISEETSNKMKEFFVEAVEDGTGKKARINNVSIGGKTGTSRQLVNGSYSTTNYNSSFIGFFPAESPKYIILILVSAPSKAGYYGGAVAAPIFKKIAEKIISLDPEIEQSIIEKNNQKFDFVLTSNTSANSFPVEFKSNHITHVNNFEVDAMPDLRGVLIKDAVTFLSSKKIKINIKGTGKVLTQSVAPGTKLSGIDKCLIEGESVNQYGAVLY